MDAKMLFKPPVMLGAVVPSLKNSPPTVEMSNVETMFGPEGACWMEMPEVKLLEMWLIAVFSVYFSVSPCWVGVTNRGVSR